MNLKAGGQAVVA